MASLEQLNYFQTPHKISLNEIVFNQRNELIQLRRHFHRNPELSFKEYETSKYIASYLRNLSSSLIIRTNIAKTGISALLIGDAGDGPCIGLRADMDALPVQEDNNFEYKSIHDGISHCCGHDFHIAILLVVAKVLCSMKTVLSGSVKFIFQPAEEDGAGARYMVEEGVLNNPAVDQIYGLHVSSSIPLGGICVNKEPKPLTVGCVGFCIDILGVGGHGAMPEGTKDVIVAAAYLITQIHSIVSRNISPGKLGVITIGTINSGYKDNVIADKAHMSGTMRWFNNEIGDVMKQRLKCVCEGIAHSFEVEVKLTFEETEYPALINTESEYEVVCKAARKIVDEGLNDNIDSIPASEDFSYYLQKCGGCYFFVGGKLEDGQNKIYAHHVADFKLDERCLLIGCQMFVQIVSDLLVRMKIDEQSMEIDKGDVGNEQKQNVDENELIKSLEKCNINVNNDTHKYIIGNDISLVEIKELLENKMELISYLRDVIKLDIIQTKRFIASLK